jgi:hypothetical protein
VPSASIPRAVVAIVAALALAFVAAPTRADAQARKGDDLARARALDKEGAKAYGEGRYNDAIRYFEEAYRLGGPPFELWNVAKCHLRLDQLEQAATQLERYLATPNLPKEDREEASQQLELLTKRTSMLTVSSTPSGAQVTLDGKILEGRTPLSVTIPPGSHTVVVSSASSPSVVRQVDARYGRAVIVEASFAAEDHRPPPPPNPYDAPEGGPLSLRGAFGVVLPRYGEIGGTSSVGLTVLGTYRFSSIGRTAISAGGLVTLSGDSWGNRTGQPNAAPGCAALANAHAQSATALSIFALASASHPLGSRVRIVGLGGAGLATYFVCDVGGDLFIPSCQASPGVRPAMIFGAELDFALTSYMRLSAFPLTWQFQPSFDGTRAAPRDASGVWMRFGIGIGAGVDL